MIAMTFPAFDTDLLLWLNQSTNFLLDSVMCRLSSTWTWMLILLAVAVVTLRNRPPKEALAVFLGLALCVVLADQISASLIKPLVCRLRPTHDPDLVMLIRTPEGRGGLYGFVSSHAANLFAVSTFLTLLLRHTLVSVALFLWACAVAASRVYLAKHFPLDVICGACLGVAVGMLTYTLLHFLKRMVGVESQQYYSDAYTATGFAIQDMNILLSAMAITLVYVLF